ncbi:hypothetical protein CVT24_003225 [Panaeolus cyanescens]|uniref:non-specific serine/threonine protein kinase n=1 Tax=Panaeolus cyanescens TaxID=181874 RepID=A0A409VFW8_9AGAR|nr:hypothetical protein CVT24_003225 [Panaeolus cyanescens]
MFSSLFSRLPLSLSSASGGKKGNQEADETVSGQSLSLPWPVTEAAGPSSYATNRPKREGSIIWSHQGQAANGVTISNPIPRMTTNPLADFDDYPSSHHSPRTPNMKGPNSASIASAGSVKSGRAPFSSGLIQSSLEDKGQRNRPQRMGSYSQAPMLHTPVLQNIGTQSSAPLQTPQSHQTPIQYGQAVTSSAPSTPFYSYAPPEVVRVESGTDSEDTTRKVAGSPEMLHQVPPDILRPSSLLGEYVPLTRKTQPQPFSEQPSPETSHALYSYPYGIYGDGMNQARESNTDFDNSPVDEEEDKEIPEVFHFPPKSVSSSSSSSGQTATATKATFRQGLKLYVPPYAQSTHSSQSDNSILRSTYAFPLPPSHFPNFVTGQSLGHNQAYPVDVTTAQQIQIQAPLSSAGDLAYCQGVNTDVYANAYNYPLATQLSPIEEQDYVSPASAAASVSMASSRFKFRLPGFVTADGSKESVLPSAVVGRQIGVAEGDDKGSMKTQRTGSIGSVANSLKGHQTVMNMSRAGSLSVLQEGLEAAAEGGSTGSAGDREPGPVLGLSQTSSRSDGQNQPTTPHTPGHRLSAPTSVRDFNPPHTPTPTFLSNPNASMSMILSPTSTIATTGTTNVSMHTPASTFIHSSGTISPVPGQTPVSSAAGLIVTERPMSAPAGNVSTTSIGANTTAIQRPAPVITIKPMPQYQTQQTGDAGAQPGGGGLLKLPSLPNITPIDLRFSSFLGKDRGTNKAAGTAQGQGSVPGQAYVDGIEEGEEYYEGDYVVDYDGEYDYDEEHGEYDRESLHEDSYIKDVEGQKRNGKGRQVDADEDDDFELDTLGKEGHRLSSESMEPPPAPLSPMPPKSLRSFKSGDHQLKTGESFIHRRWERDVPMGVSASPTLFRTRSPSRWFFKKTSDHTPAFWAFWFGFLFPVLWLIAGWHFTNAGEMPPKVTMWEWYFLRGSRWWLQGVTGRIRTVFGCCVPRRPASQRSSGSAEAPHLHHTSPGSVTLRQGIARKKMSAAQSQARIGKVYPALPRWVAEKQSTDDGRMRLNDPKRSLRGISFGYPFIPRPLGSHGSYTGMNASEMGSHSVLGRMMQRLLHIVTFPNRVLDHLYGVKLREVRGRPEIQPDVDSQALVQRNAPPPVPNTVRYIQDEQAKQDFLKDNQLVDIILLASVDGKFHALNRTTGKTLWSMSSISTTTSVSGPSSLAPLVRSSQLNFEPDLDDIDFDEENPRETYIIEPQSGSIYVVHRQNGALQRFPLSMSELADLSPFSSHDGDEVTIFVAKKETSLVLLELETGKIRATLTAECPFIDVPATSRPIDLDELESDTGPPEDDRAYSEPTGVYISRTDYQISIYKAKGKGLPMTHFQNLSVSIYGPNKKDQHVQTLYRKSSDGLYVQSAPNGDVYAFQDLRSEPADGRKQKPIPPGGQLSWALSFQHPIVAVFDIFRPTASYHSSHAFALLQPKPKLNELFPDKADKELISRGLSSAFVSMVEESNSLYVMSADEFPLIAIGKSNEGNHPHHPPSSGEPYSGQKDLEIPRCRANPYDPMCLVGVHKLEDSNGPEWRMKRLLDAPATSSQTPMGTPGVAVAYGEDGVLIPIVGQSRENGDNTSGAPSPPPVIPSASVPSPVGVERGASGNGLILSGQRMQGTFSTAWEGLAVAIVVGSVSLYFLWIKFKKAIEDKIREEHQKILLETKQAERVPSDIIITQNLAVDRIASPVEPTIPVPLETVPTLNGNAETTSQELVVPIPQPSDPALTANETGDQSPPPTAVPSMIPAPNTTEEAEDSEGEGEPGTSATPGKKPRAKRGKRGRRKKGGAAGLAASNSGNGDAEENGAEAPKEDEKKNSSTGIILSSSSPKPPVVQTPSLVVSDNILGFGSHGTVVFQGSLQGRAVAVKRLLQDFVTLAAREVSILQESDDHPNVIRYYYQEAHANFLYIALELCPASLADIVETPDRDAWRDIAVSFDPKKALRQITSGLRHLHALKLVHRDIKPQNILISAAKGAAGSAGSFGKGYRMLISDFGLCKKLDVDQTSFLPTAHGSMAAGTVGWRAPEILRGEVKLDEMTSGDDSLSSRGSVATIHGSMSGTPAANGKPTRLTKSVDIFALGCLFYYTLTSGSHPFGDRFEREINIMKNAKFLEGLDKFGEEGTEAKDLIVKMLDPEASERPDTTTCLLHPFFWDPARRLNFLQDASDRFEIMCRDPKDPHLLTLEKNAAVVVGNDWYARLDKIFVENLGKFRKYDGKSVQDLLRALRNKKHHYQDLPDNVKRHVGPMPDGFLGYFTRRYPQLFLHVHGVIRETGLNAESMFRSYFELPDS